MRSVNEQKEKLASLKNELGMHKSMTDFALLQREKELEEASINDQAKMQERIKEEKSLQL